MDTRDIPLAAIDVSEYNVRKNLADGQFDSTIRDLAASIAKQGLLSPIIVFKKEDQRYGLIAGQRRLLACRSLGWSTISATIHASISEADATAISLVENVHRADMSPGDKAIALKALLERHGDYETVSRQTGIGVPTIRKYVNLLGLAPELRDRLAAGNAKNTEALAQLAQRIPGADAQVDVWNQIGGFTQDVQLRILKQLSPALDNLEALVTQALKGEFDLVKVGPCPWDCPTIPEDAKEEVAAILLSRGVVPKARPRQR